jgi:hypothetical protein
MPNSAPEIWSAVAASFAALSSFLVMLIQRRNLLDSARPELVLIGWNRKMINISDSRFDVIFVQSIRNVGKGPAINIIMNTSDINESKDKLKATLSTKHIPFLEAGASEDINAEIMLYWENVDADPQGRKHMDVGIEIICWDSRDMRHETYYGLIAGERPDSIVMSFPTAPGVTVGTRRTRTTPVWWLKILSRVNRLRIRNPDA